MRGCCLDLGFFFQLPWDQQSWSGARDLTPTLAKSSLGMIAEVAKCGVSASSRDSAPVPPKRGPCAAPGGAILGKGGAGGMGASLESAQ